MARAEFRRQTKRNAWERANGHCEAAGCSKPIFRRIYCTTHYTRFIRHGDIADESRKNVAAGESLSWLVREIGTKSNKCIIFPFPRSSAGYGRVTYKGKRIGAHRMMCILAHGYPPSSDYQTAHSCGCGHLGCVNPKHLRWATCSENHADRLIHGTDNRGEKHGKSKLRRTEVVMIRKMGKRGIPHHKIATRYGVHEGTIGKIIRRERWVWL